MSNRPSSLTSPILAESLTVYNLDDLIEQIPSRKMDFVCFSHLRWDFVFQRPQHLLTRFSRGMRVFFVEEPMFGAESNSLVCGPRQENIFVVTPHLQHGLSHSEVVAAQQTLLDAFFKEQKINNYVFWYYTPMALSFSRSFTPRLTVYDCMDELSAFVGAPAEMKAREAEMFRKADIVFTGGQSLYEHKANSHRNIHPFPSSIDGAHFATAKTITEEPADQANIPHPRLGFYGVVDERMDLDLLAGIADLRPDWHLVIIGPVVKIDPASLPQRKNIHYLGGKSYAELPSYLASWDVALLPFAINESTKFISPTKTPEYLAAGRSVVSTAIRDVVRPYGEQGLVHIANTPEAFVLAISQALRQNDDNDWKVRVQTFLNNTSWERTWARMVHLMAATLVEKGTTLPEANGLGEVTTTVTGKQPFQTVSKYKPNANKEI